MIKVKQRGHDASEGMRVTVTVGAIYGTLSLLASELTWAC